MIFHKNYLIDEIGQFSMETVVSFEISPEILISFKNWTISHENFGLSKNCLTITQKLKHFSRVL